MSVPKTMFQLSGRGYAAANLSHATLVIIDAQKEVAATLPRARYVDTAGAETLPPSHTHFTAVGTLEIGRRYAETLLLLEQTK